MPTSEFDSAGPFKRSTRMPLDAVVRLHFEGTVAYQNGFAANVSATGMFVKHPDPPAVGTRLVFEFTLGELRKPVQGGGLVVWVRERYDGPGRPAGIGIQFTQLDPQSRQHLAEAMFEFLEASLAGMAAEREDEEVVAVVPEPDLPAPVPLPPGPPAVHTPEFHLEPALEPLPVELEGSLVEIQVPAAAEAPRSIPTSWSLAEESERAMPPLAAAEPAAPAESERRPSFSFAPPETPEPPAETEEQRIERIVREALADDPPYAGAAAAKSTSSGGHAWLAVGLVAALAAGGWALWRYVLAPGGESAPVALAEPPAPTPTPRPTLPAVPGPEGTLAQTVGATTAAESAPAAPLPGATEPPEDAAASEVADSEAQPPAAAVAPPAARATAPAPPPPLPDEGGAPRARALTDIEWTEATGITLITLTADGNLAPGSYSYSEIGGDKPRVLIRLRGLRTPYRRGQLALDTATVIGIRNGWHERPEGDEQHVVIDLRSDRSRLDGFETLGSRIVIKIGQR